MLVLTRKTHESVMITDEIEVTIVEIDGNKVRIGFTAPKDIPIHRKEIWLLVKEQEASEKRGGK